mmetsp:Transcript_29574/g.90718  ORF Transcript_29574/g.90718 Transcript_29574/m.90718 type:complete len:164 (-) Transcript_29574:742-1233(-)|eukprot:scaffold297439_cov41-Tisochrysis_lutea.AAC.2
MVTSKHIHSLKVMGMARNTATQAWSSSRTDGRWTSVSSKPIINALVSLPVGSYFLEALDTEGQTKDAAFIADFTIKHICAFEEGLVVGVCMDGACISSFELINAKFPNIFTFICPTHSIDNFIKNVFAGSKDVIRMRGITRTFAWAKTFFAARWTRSGRLSSL